MLRRANEFHSSSVLVMDTGASQPPICVAALLFKAQTGVRTDHSRTFTHTYAAPHAPPSPSVSLCSLSRHPRTQSLLAVDDAATTLMRQLPRWQHHSPPLAFDSAAIAAAKPSDQCMVLACSRRHLCMAVHMSCGGILGFHGGAHLHARGARHRIMTACAIAKRRQHVASARHLLLTTIRLTRGICVCVCVCVCVSVRMCMCMFERPQKHGDPVNLESKPISIFQRAKRRTNAHTAIHVYARAHTHTTHTYTHHLGQKANQSQALQHPFAPGYTSYVNVYDVKPPGSAWRQPLQPWQVPCVGLLITACVCSSFTPPPGLVNHNLRHTDDQSEENSRHSQPSFHRTECGPTAPTSTPTTRASASPRPSPSRRTARCAARS